MANWEYKVISSGKGGFASPALMEKFINDLGQDQWEIINFHTAPDNPLAFTGLARRTTLRDWTLEDAVATAARAETDKLRVEFEAKFKAGTTGAASLAEEKEPSFAEEKASPDDGYRRPVDTSRDDDPDAPEDDWQKLSAEDELPSFFDALKPHMRRNQRGPGMSVGLDFLAKKWKLEETDIKGALVECGMQIPGDENAKPVCVEYDGDIFWVNINRRGEIWINTREKPDPVFRIVPGKRLSDEEVAASDIAAPNAPRETSVHIVLESAPPERKNQPASEQRHEQSRPDGRGDAREQGSNRQPPSGAPRAVEQVFAPKTLLTKVRGMMRRNRRGHGWSGSFSYLTKALKLDQAQLLEAVGEFGLRLGGGKEPVLADEGNFTYWLNQNSNGEIWINAEEKRGERNPVPAAPVTASAEDAAPSGAQDAGASGHVYVQPTSAEIAPEPVIAKGLPPENTLTAVRLLMQPKKRGEGFTASVTELAEKLEKSGEQMLAVLGSAGLHLPESPKGKPTFAEHGDEIFWLNANAKGQVWVNAKQAAARKSRAKKTTE